MRGWEFYLFRDVGPGMGRCSCLTTPAHPRFRTEEEARNYWSNLVTACCVLLACASALMPVWVRIWNFAISDVAWL